MGGYELLCQEFVGWLRQRGHEVRVVTSTFGLKRGNSDVEKGPAGEQIDRVLELHWRDFRHRRPNVVLAWASELRQRRIVESILHRYSPDAAHIWGMAALSKSILEVIHRSGTPMLAVVGEHWPVWDVKTDTWVRIWSRRPPAGLRPVWRALQTAADRAVAPTDVAAAMEAIIPIFASENIGGVVEAAVPSWRGRGAVVPNGVQANLFQSGAGRGAAFPTPVRLLYAGRIERRKGPHTAIHGLARIQSQGIPTRLTMIGWADAAYSAELRQLAYDLRVDSLIEWRQAVARDRMANIYRDHDILLFPSIWDEPFGLVPLEAMAAGCVVVATGTGGSASYLAHGKNALLFPPEDDAALAACVQELMHNDQLVARLRSAGLDAAKAHSFEDYATRLLELTQDVIAGSGRAHRD
jgi:glycosyltransferase involved in cell wall biosynthesis